MQISYHQKKPVKNKHKRYHYYKKDGRWKPKLKFETIKDAENYLTAINKLGELKIYRCPYCKKFHIGHVKREK